MQTRRYLKEHGYRQQQYDRDYDFEDGKIDILVEIFV